ncbi:MAG: glycosyl hydrolase 108 family protein [Syntrophus sp. (in: bacteria)]|nr:glycosyl hydrolase 108 family protein [Syntrophus sp. (in: bacteria)]
MIDTRFISNDERMILVNEMRNSKEWNSFFSWLMDREGRVVHHDPRDPGEQTAWGISRKYHPNATIWKLVDKGVTDTKSLEPHVREFYIEFLFRWWFLCNGILRYVLCDSYVNMGMGKSGDVKLDAGELLQQALNCLAQKKYLVVDGDIGNNTILALRTENHTALAYTMITLRWIEYRRRGTGSLSWALNGWLNRVEMLTRFVSTF